MKRRVSRETCRTGKPAVSRGTSGKCHFRHRHPLVTIRPALAAGGGYALAALAASLIPLTAGALLIATTRTKSVRADRMRDAAVADRKDPFPGIGMDDDTPLGDTPEHSDAERSGQRRA